MHPQIKLFRAFGLLLLQIKHLQEVLTLKLNF